jgi:maltose alpha-D-glucosyltransferase / alpha-amylase
VLAYLREFEGETILCVANVSHSPQAVELDLSEFAGRVPVEMDGGSVFPPVGQLTYLLTLPPYGFYWFVLAQESDAPSWHTPAPEPMPDYVTIVLRDQLADVLASVAGVELARDTIPAYLGKRRWFAAKDQSLQSARIAYLARLPGGDRELLLSELEVRTTDGKTSRWQLPLTMVWEDEPSAALPTQLALARVRRGRRVGLLTDAFSLPGFGQQMLANLVNGAEIETVEGRIVFNPEPDKVELLRRPPDSQVLWLSAEQSNSSLIVDDAVMLKIFRRIAPGQHPEAEMSRYLTSHGFANSPLMLGEVVRLDKEGERFSLAVAQSFVRNQGDAWTWTLDQFNRSLDNHATREANEEARHDDILDYKEFAATMGRQLGAMHVVLAAGTDDEAFAPRLADREDVAVWIERARASLDRAFDALAQRTIWENEQAAAEAQEMLALREATTALLGDLAGSGAGSLMTRIHGDFHLGQVLVATGDAYIIDFEGEPSRPLTERRAKASPLRDVAGLLRSFDYALATSLDPKNMAAARVPEEIRRKVLTRLWDGARRAFLDAYHAAVGDLPGLGNSDLLDFFLIEKAAYEIGYEAANRPAWLPIPLNGLARIIRRLRDGGEGSAL